MATVKHDNLWFCVDCMLAHCNGETDPHNSEERDLQITRGFETFHERFGGHPAANYGSKEDEGENEGEIESSSLPCACCRTRLIGSRYRFSAIA